MLGWEIANLLEFLYNLLELPISKAFRSSTNKYPLFFLKAFLQETDHFINTITSAEAG